MSDKPKYWQRRGQPAPKAPEPAPEPKAKDEKKPKE